MQITHLLQYHIHIYIDRWEVGEGDEPMVGGAENLDVWSA